MDRFLAILGAERYNPAAVCLTYDPLMLYLYIGGHGVNLVSYLVIGSVILIRYKMNLDSPTVVRVSLRPLYGIFVLLCAASQLLGIITLFSAIYRLDVFIIAAMAGVAGATAYFTLIDYLKRGKEKVGT